MAIICMLKPARTYRLYYQRFLRTLYTQRFAKKCRTCINTYKCNTSGRLFASDVFTHCIFIGEPANGTKYGIEKKALFKIS